MKCKVCGAVPFIPMNPDYCSLACKAEDATASYEASVLNAWNIVHDHIRASMDGIQWKNNRAKTLNNYHF